MSKATSNVVDICGVPNDVLTSTLSEIECSSRARTPSYEWAPDSVLCAVYYDVLLSTLGFALPLDTPFAQLELFCAAVAGAHSECTVAQYGRGLVRLFQFVEPFEAIAGRTAVLFICCLWSLLFFM